MDARLSQLQQPRPNHRSGVQSQMAWSIVTYASSTTRLLMCNSIGAFLHTLHNMNIGPTNITACYTCTPDDVTITTHYMLFIVQASGRSSAGEIKLLLIRNYNRPNNTQRVYFTSENTSHDNLPHDAWDERFNFPDSTKVSIEWNLKWAWYSLIRKSESVLNVSLSIPSWASHNIRWYRA